MNSKKISSSHTIHLVLNAKPRCTRHPKTQTPGFEHSRTADMSQPSSGSISGLGLTLDKEELINRDQGEKEKCNFRIRALLTVGKRGATERTHHGEGIN